MARKKYKLLTYKDRKKLEEMYLNNERPSDIADKLGVHTATIYKELQQGDTGALDKNLRSEYSAELAQRKTTESLKNRGRNLEEAAALFVKSANPFVFCEDRLFSFAKKCVIILLQRNKGEKCHENSQFRFLQYRYCLFLGSHCHCR